jgi:hypothetical protein
VCMVFVFFSLFLMMMQQAAQIQNTVQNTSILVFRYPIVSSTKTYKKLLIYSLMYIATHR